MLNKRAARLLALLLTSSMVLMGPSAAMASTSAGDSKETSQTEQEESTETDAEDQTAEDPKAEEDADEDPDAVKETEKAQKDKKDKKEEKTEKKKKEEMAKEPSRAKEGSVSDGESVSGDAEVAARDLVVSTNAPTTVDETVSGNIVISSADGADLTFNGVKAESLHVERGTGNVKIQLSGTNILSEIKIDNDGHTVTIGGPGILSSNSAVGGTSTQLVVISGGNIQADFAESPVNGAGTVLYPVAVSGLTADTSYTISMERGNPLSAYSYGSRILTDGTGGIRMYLPTGRVQVTFGTVQYEGTVASGSASVLHRVYPSPSPSSSPNPSPSSSPSPSPNPSPSTTPTGTQDRQQANPADNGLFWINPGATYRSGATLQFYATGAGYGPEEPQERNPIRNATRYIPVSWNVGGESGSWKKYTEETIGQTTSGNSYQAGEYRFKDSFVLSTNQASSVPYTLKVNYKRQTYNGRRWRDDGTTTAKEVNFFIRNISVTATPSYRPTTTPYYRSNATTTAARSSVSSNARNARTMDNTPIGSLILLMMAAAGSGAVIFRKKRNRS